MQMSNMQAEKQLNPQVDLTLRHVNSQCKFEHVVVCSQRQLRWLFAATLVAYPSGRAKMKSCAFASFAASCTSSCINLKVGACTWLTSLRCVLECHGSAQEWCPNRCGFNADANNAVVNEMAMHTIYRWCLSRYSLWPTCVF